MKNVHNTTNAVCDRYMPRITFRPDGWPLCPQCGQDELYSLENPPTIESIRGCYLCGPISPAAIAVESTVEPHFVPLAPLLYRDEPVNQKLLWQLIGAFVGAWVLFLGTVSFVVALARGWRLW